MVNRFKGEAEFIDEDVTYRLCLTVDAMVQIEDVTDVPVTQFVNNLGRLGFSARLLQIAVEAGSGQILTQTQAREMVLLRSDVVAPAIMQALGYALPSAPEAGAEDQEQEAGADASANPLQKTRKVSKRNGTGTNF